MSYLLFDIGGTSTKVARVDSTDTVTNPLKFPTPSTIEEFFAELPNHIDTSNITHIVAGITGTFNQERTTLLVSPHLPQWAGFNIQQKFADHFNAQVLFRNDTELVGLGEAVYGSGKDTGLLVYITISTGFGGVKIEHAKIDDAYTGFEPGHQIIDISEDGSYVTLESIVSGSGIAERTKNQPELENDPAFWDEVHTYVAIGLYNITLHWSPEKFVLGGGLITSEKIKVEQVQSYFDKIYTRVPLKPEIIKSALGDFGGLYGALELLRMII